MTKTVSLVLGSGGARGYAHIGVIDALLRRGYNIVSISGCSMGALVGGLFAAGKLDDYRDWVSQLSSVDVLRLLDVRLGSPGLIRGDKVFAVINDLVGDLKIEDLPINYTAVATDIVSQKEVWFQRGDLQTAMRASIAIPSLFSPVIQGNRVLVDGGVLNPLPIAPSVSAHADYIIAVDVSAEPNRCIAVSLQAQEEEAARENHSEESEEHATDVEAGAASAASNVALHTLPAVSMPQREQFDAGDGYEDVAVSEDLDLSNLGRHNESQAFNVRPESETGEPKQSGEGLEEDISESMGFDSWVNVFRHRAFQYFDRNAETEALSQEDVQPSAQDIKSNESRLGFLSMINQSFETMQSALTQYKIAGYPPDLLIEVPKTACRIYEFNKAQALIELGDNLANEALNRLEARQVD